VTDSATSPLSLPQTAQRPSMLLPVLALGATQIIGYGTIYYAFSLLAPHMAIAVGWSQAAVFGALSVGLLVGGLLGPDAGRMMDRHGAARLMAAGSLVAAALLALQSLAVTGWQLAAVIVALEAIGVIVLYDGAFALLSQFAGTSARRSITHLTLIAGFASSIFWPLTSVLLDHLDWRAVLLMFAALHACVCLPLHLLLARRRLPSAEPAARSAAASAPMREPEPVPASARRSAFWLIAIAFSLQAFITAAMGVHMVPAMQAMGLGEGALLAAALMGPSQVAIRLTDAMAWKGLHPLNVALVSSAALPLSLLVLLAGAPWLAAGIGLAVLFGIGQGLQSIVRGTVPLALFGAVGYGELLGRLGLVRVLFSAAAPVVFALLLESQGPRVALGVSIVVGVLALGPLVVLALRHARWRDS